MALKYWLCSRFIYSLIYRLVYEPWFVLALGLHYDSKTCLEIRVYFLIIFLAQNSLNGSFPLTTLHRLFNDYIIYIVIRINLTR